MPIGIAALVLVRAWLPAPAPRVGPVRPLDLPGVALLAAGVFTLLLPAVQFDANHDPRLALLLLPALGLLAAFWLGARAGRAARLPADRPRPVQDPLVRGRDRAGGAVLLRVHRHAAGAGAVPAGGLGYTPLQSGLTASAFAVGVTVASPIGGRLLPRLGARVLVGGLVLFTVGVAAAGLTGALAAGRVWAGGWRCCSSCRCWSPAPAAAA